ncbi:MAG: glycosyltransferase [Alphaproteobacteria bacterium]|nr:glycosyltransferase [Alphaproteobacteria bacterium]
MKIMLARDRNVLNTNWLIYFANLLAERGHDVIIACDTYSKLGNMAPKYSLHKKVRVCNLSGKDENKLINLYHKVRAKLIPPYFRFNKLIKKEKPDVIICYFPTDLFNVTRFQNHNIPIIQMLHCVPDTVLGKYLRKPKFTRPFYKNSFKKIDIFQVLMPSFKDMINPWFEPKRVVQIGNPVEQYKDDDIADLSIEKKKIFYVARIERGVKQPHVLVEVFNKIKDEFPDWQVEIWGLRKFPDYDKEITDLIESYGLKDRVKLMGYSNDVLSIYKNSDINAFVSAAEGFGLTLADAMAMGVPAVGFKSAKAVNELIIDGKSGFLADDIDDFAEKLKMLMLDKELRIKMGKNARQDIKRFASDSVIDKWEEVINSVTKK